MNHCSVISCLNIRRNSRFRFFTFPSDPDTCSQWVEFCRCPEITERFTTGGPYGLSKFAICSEHFDPAIVAQIGKKSIHLPTNTVPDRIGKQYVTQTMLANDKIVDKPQPVVSQGRRQGTEASEPPPHIDAVLVEMLDPDELDQESGAGGESNFEFIRLKTDDKRFEFEDGFKQEFVDPDENPSVPEVRSIPSGSSNPTQPPSEANKECKICSNFKPRYECEVRKNKRLEDLIRRNKRKIAETTTKQQKMHDQITLKRVKRIELKKKYMELKQRLKKAKKGSPLLMEEMVEAETKTAAESEDEEDEASFDETAAWW